MKEISSQSLYKIRDVIPGQNYNNIKARLDQHLPPEFASMFAKLSISGDRAIWYGEDSISHKPYSDASDSEREEIAIALEECKNYACENLNVEMPYIDKVFIVPSKEEIFWYHDETGRMIVTLAQWGFRKKQEAEGVDVITILISEPRTMTRDEVIVKFFYSDGLPASNCPFSLTAFNNTKRLASDENGKYNLGKLFAGNKFTIENPEGTERYEFIVSPKDDYDVLFNIETAFKVVVKNGQDQTKPNFEIKVDGNMVKTDEKGEYKLEKVVLRKEHKVNVCLPDNSGIAEFQLQRDEEENTFVYKIQETQAQTPPTPPPPIPPMKPATKTAKVRLLDFDGQPLPGITFQIVERGVVTIERTTDENGVATFPVEVLKNRKKYRITFSITPEQREAINRGHNNTLTNGTIVNPKVGSTGNNSIGSKTDGNGQA